MVYAAAPYPMEAVGEMPGYYVPVYDQAGNATLVPATSARDPHQQQTTILQAAPPPGTHVYQATPNTTLIPALPAGSQLVYAPDGQFGTATMQQPQPFAMPAGSGYPPGTTVTYATPYGTAYNATPSTYHANFWGQPMTTYYVSSPPAQAVPQPQAVPIQIPVQMPPPMNTQQSQNGHKGGNHSSPATPLATTFGGNPFGSAVTGGQMSGSGGESMPPPPVYAMPMAGHHPQQQQSHNNKYQNVYSPYSTPVVQMHQQPSVVAASAATPPSAGYPQPYHQQGQPPVHSGHVNKPLATHTPPQQTITSAATAGSSSNDTSSTTSTPLQKSPPTQMPESSVNSSYDKKPRRGPTTELSGSAPANTGTPATTQQAVPPPRTTGYLGNNYNSAYARNPNQTYTPRGYAPKKHYSTEGAPNSAGGQLGQHGKPLVLNTPMHQSSPSPGIYNHYHPSQQQQPTAQGGGPNVHGIRGPRPKPANLDLRRTGSHYQSSNVTGGVSTAPATGNQNHSNSQRNTPSTNSAESNNSPNSVTGGGPGGNGMEQQQHSSRGQMGYYPNQAAGGGGGGPHHSGGHPLVMHQPLMGSPASHPSGHPGMYVKLAGQTYFPHVSDNGEESRGRGT